MYSQLNMCQVSHYCAQLLMIITEKGKSVCHVFMKTDLLNTILRFHTCKYVWLIKIYNSRQSNH